MTCRGRRREVLSESRMRAIRTSGSAAFALRYRSQTGQRSPTITRKTARAARSARCSTQDKNGLAAAWRRLREPVDNEGP